MLFFQTKRRLLLRSSSYKKYLRIRITAESQPKIFVHDFEKAALNAIKSVFPEVQIHGCYFHFAQNLWKNMQNKNLSKKYLNNSITRLSFKKLKALCFLPTTEVIQAFKLIEKSSAPDFQPMIGYFEKWYIGKPKSNCPGVRLVPSYPITTWNCYQRVLNDEQRTNNSLESWHQQFEQAFGKHPTLHKLIEQFRREQKNTEILVVQLNVDVYNKTKRCQTVDDQYVQLCCSGKNPNLANTLKNFL